MLPAIALAAVLLATNDPSRTQPTPTTPATSQSDSTTADSLSGFNLDFSFLADFLSRESFWRDMGPWAIELGVSPDGGGGEDVGAFIPRDGERPALPLGFDRPWAASIGVHYHASRRAMIGLSYSQNSIDYSWTDPPTGDTYSVGKAIVGTWRADFLLGRDPFDPAHEDPWGVWIGPTVAIALPRWTSKNPNQADSVYVEHISARTAWSYGLLLRGEYGFFNLFFGADATLWIHNGATLLDFHTAERAAYDGDRGEHWPPWLRLRMGLRW